MMKLQAFTEVAKEIMTVSLNESESVIIKLYHLYGKYKVKNNLDVQTPNGIAISPIGATNCIKDYKRTFLFIISVIQALEKLLKKNEGNIEVVYAGCGAYAPLIIPALVYLNNERLSVTCIDYNKESCFVLKKIINKLNLQKSVKVINSDAATYKHLKWIDLVICETMDKALTVEPQVAITRNLAQQIAIDGLLLPEKVILKAKYGNEDMLLFQLSKNTLDFDNFFTEFIEPKDNGAEIIITTELKIFQQNRLKPEDSIITANHKIGNLGNLKNKRFFALHYSSGLNPAWKITYK